MKITAIHFENNLNIITDLHNSFHLLDRFVLGGKPTQRTNLHNVQTYTTYKPTQRTNLHNVQTYTTYNEGFCRGSYVRTRNNTWLVQVVGDMNENGKTIQRQTVIINNTPIHTFVRQVSVSLYQYLT